MSNPLAWPLRQLRRGLALRAVNLSRGCDLAGSVELALDVWRRLRGLIGRRELAAGTGLLLRPCRSIHTMWMRFAIDAVFLDEEGTVVGIVDALVPYRMSPFFAVALATLELPAGVVGATQTVVGDRVAFVERR